MIPLTLAILLYAATAGGLASYAWQDWRSGCITTWTWAMALSAVVLGAVTVAHTVGLYLQLVP